jgi:hypothetical protein
LKNLLAKYRTSGNDNKELIQELYYNRVSKMWVDNMFVPNFFISGMSKILNQTTDSLSRDTKREYHENLKLQVDLLIAQRNSMVIRPDILKPHQCNKDVTFKKKLELASNQWVRLGYAEYEKFKKNRFDEEIEEFRSYSGIAFLELNEETIPFSRYRFNPQHLWKPDNCPSGYDEYVCTFFFQMQDTFEQYMILWLNPIIFKELGLKLGKIDYGLKAYNKNNELCLIFNSWNTGYIGDSSLYNDVTNEIPMLQGTELLLRKDYFDLMCAFFEGQPYYYTFSH